MTLNQSKDAIIAGFIQRWQFEHFPPVLQKLLNKHKNLDQLKIEGAYPVGVYRKVARQKSILADLFSSLFVMSYSAEELKKLRANSPYHNRPHLYTKKIDLY